ncbi:MAG TPA: efflux RND transporter periplasmic adaptor subunit [Thermoanaerobaculia bacterium]|nr:efflux RND transporter periplasmic adaptor subunit [Thermoanaerobaculia bacterium]
MSLTVASARGKVLVVAGAAVVLLAGAGLLRHGSGKPRYLTLPVKRGPLTATVEATGTINPLTTVPVGSSVSGTVKYIFADFNSRVRAGQVLAQLDPQIFEAQVATARGNLKNLEAGLDVARAAIQVGEANVSKLQADLDYARANASRIADLHAQGLVPVDQRDLTQSSLAQSEAAVRAAQAQVVQARAQFQQGIAQVEAMKGALDQAETNLRYTTILSPTEGVVVARNITVGQSVAASLQAPNVFTIAQDLKRMQVYAKTDESDTGFIRVGAEASFQVDALPNETFRGRVSAVRLNAYAVQNVVTYDTIIDCENPEEKLLPGETAYVSIPTGHAENALQIPNAAMTVSPPVAPDDLERLYKERRIPPAAYTSHAGGQQVVWRLAPGDRIEPVAVKVGISDYAFSQVLEGGLKEGDLLITGVAGASGSGSQSKAPIPGRAPAAKR